jgi:excisionase family DNA binding protein
MESVIKKPTAQQRVIARKSHDSLELAIAKSETPTVIISLENHKVELPREAANLLVDILSKMANGDSVALTSIEEEMTTQEAADLLQVSRPHLVKLVETGKIPFKKVGSHRRVLMKDVKSYNIELQKIRNESLDFLAKQAQELGLGYD